MNRRIASALLIPILLLAGCVQIQVKERATAPAPAPEPARTMLLDNPIEWDKEVLVVVRVRLWGQPTMEEGVRAMRRVGRAKGWQETSLRLAWLQDNGKTLVLVGQPTGSRKRATMKHDPQGRPSAH